VSIERSRQRARISGSTVRHPRPEGISRRVATAARDRQLGPLPEQRPTGWHRLVFANPSRSDQPIPIPIPTPTPTPTPPVPGPSQSDPSQSDPSLPDLRHPAWPPTAAVVGRPLQSTGPASESEPEKVRPAAGPGRGGTHRQPPPVRHQIGRVLDPRPDRVRRSAMLVAALAAAAAAGVCAVLLVSAESATPEPAPGPVPSVVVSEPASVDPAAPAPTPTPAAAAPTAAPSVVSPSVGPVAPAVVSTLTPGDPGFGWPSTAFGSAPADR
jgi:hypothetical protein